MKWFSVLKVSRKDAISDAMRFAPEDIKEGKKNKDRAYARFRARESRNPSKIELRNEIIKPFYRERPKPTGRPKGSKNKIKVKSEMQVLVNNIILYLEANNKPVTEESVINEIDLDKIPMTKYNRPDKRFVKVIGRMIEEFKNPHPHKVYSRRPNYTQKDIQEMIE